MEVPIWVGDRWGFWEKLSLPLENLCMGLTA